MISIVRSFGAPVIEPRREAGADAVGGDPWPRRPRTAGDELVHRLVGLEVHQLGHLTLPSRRRGRGRCAAGRRSSGSRRGSSVGAQSRRARASSAGVSPRRLVPLIGLASTERSRSTPRKRSGDELRIAASPKRRKAAKGAGLARAAPGRGRTDRPIGLRDDPVGETDLIGLPRPQSRACRLAMSAR